MSKTVRVGQMPGKIEEFAVNVGDSIASVIALAGLSASGFDVKVDGNKVTDLEGTTVTSSTNLILLAKQVKGNADHTVRVGQMPGKIESYAIDTTQTIAQVLELAGLSASGFDVKVDGNKVTDLNQQIGSANLVLLAKQVKGNNIGTTPTQQTYGTKTVRVGMMPGKIEEYAVQVGDSVAHVLSIANLSASGYDVKVDGAKVTDLEGTKVSQSTNLILLAKQVKGNK